MEILKRNDLYSFILVGIYPKQQELWTFLRNFPQSQEGRINDQFLCNWNQKADNSLLYNFQLIRFIKIYYYITVLTSGKMRYTERFRLQAIHEWKSCYLNYEHLKVLVKIIRDSVRERIQLDDIMRYGLRQEIKTNQMISMKRIQLPQEQQKEIGSYYGYFLQSSNEAQAMFEKCYQQNISLFGKFVQWKFKDIEIHFQMCKTFHFAAGEKDQNLRKRVFKSYLEYIFVEAFFLAHMMQTNIQAEWRILAKHKLYATDLYQTPQPIVNSYVGIDECHKLRRSIQRFYFKIMKKSKEQNRYRLRKLAEGQTGSTNRSLIIGVLSGAVVAIIVFMVIILARASITLQSDPIFNMDFPLFRGVSYMLFYIWALGIDIHYFQKYKVTHRIIFQNNYTEYPVSNDLFTVSGIFSIVFVICFTLYALATSNIINLGSFSPQYLPLLIWLPFVAFLFNPLPILFFHGRLYFFKAIIRMLMTIVSTVDFPGVFATAQAITLLIVFQDIFYIICYYANFSFPLTKHDVDQSRATCRNPASLARFIYTIIIYSIRIIQTIKVGFGIGAKAPNHKEFINSIKFCTALLTAILSYAWQQSSNDRIFPAWVVFAVITSIYSSAWDFKQGWDLLHTESKNFMLRDQLIYPKLNYYPWAMINFILRCTWTLNISPNIVKGFFGSSQIFLLVFGFLEIFRRGIWNLMRVQVEQIRNNQALRALPKQKETFEQQIVEYLQKNKDKLNSISFENILQSETIIMQKGEQAEKDVLANTKKEIVKNIKQLKQMINEQKTKAQMMKETNEKTIRHLLKHVY